MRRLWPRTLGGQLVALLLGALAVSLALGFMLFSGERREAVREARLHGLLERTAAIVRLLEETPASSRDAILAAASSPWIRFGYSDESTIREAGSGRHVRWMTGLFAEMLPGGLREPARFQLSGEGGLLRRHRDNDDDDNDDDDDDDDDREEWRAGRRHGPAVHDMAISVPLSDGGWLNLTTQFRPDRFARGTPFMLSIGFMVAAILLIVGLTVGRITRPLRRLAGAAERLGRGEDVEPLAENGPDEIRRTTAAFNTMQERLTRFVRDRTRMLAAISHDLRTPMTSLRLRAELVEDAETRAKLIETLEEMQQMTEAALAFAREDATPEETRTVDLAALLESLAADLADTGMDVAFAGAPRTPCPCRPGSLRRAIRNLAENAVRYGQRARLTLQPDDGGFRITVEDDGPGIAEDDRERVFDAFVRLEESRSRETGGVGLGMTIARSIVRGHGGDISLENRPEGGLRATIRLPAGDGA